KISKRFVGSGDGSVNILRLDYTRVDGFLELCPTFGRIGAISRKKGKALSDLCLLGNHFDDEFPPERRTFHYIQRSQGFLPATNPWHSLFILPHQGRTPQYRNILRQPFCVAAVVNIRQKICLEKWLYLTFQATE